MGAATPEGFVFALKAPRRITHDARLRDVDEPLRYFCETALTLGPKLGPLLFQLLQARGVRSWSGPRSAPL